MKKVQSHCIYHQSHHQFFEVHHYDFSIVHFLPNTSFTKFPFQHLTHIFCDQLLKVTLFLQNKGEPFTSTWPLFVFFPIILYPLTHNTTLPDICHHHTKKILSLSNPHLTNNCGLFGYVPVFFFYSYSKCLQKCHLMTTFWRALLFSAKTRNGTHNETTCV